MSELLQAETIIGYTFLDKRLLETAFTHTSYVNEHGGESNERLEFLGDSILNFLVAEKLYALSEAGEGKLSVMRAELVSKKPLAAAVEELGLIEYLRMGSGAAGERVSEKFISNLFEAVVGAIYADSGSLEACRTFVFRNLKRAAAKDYKSELQEFAQGKYKTVPDYVCVSSEAGFVCTVSLAGRKLGTGEAPRKKEAEQAAAECALRALNG